MTDTGGEIVATFESVDAYAASLPADVRPKFESVRRAILRAVPGSEESISYHIAAFKLHGRYYASLAGWKRHLSIYPIPDADADLDRELAGYKSGKGTLQFPLGKPIPLDLVGKVAALLAEQRAADRPGPPGNGLRAG